MTNSNTLDILTNSSNPSNLLTNLKDLKNTVIGNTWKKVEVAEDQGLLQLLLTLLKYPSSNDVDSTVALELMSETAVIIGALANVGKLTLQPLLLSSTPSALLCLITSLNETSDITVKQLEKILPHLLRALRNILISTADMVWGHMWGVGAERKVIGTGLVGVEIMSEKEVSGKGKQVAGKGAGNWRSQATAALSSIFEAENLVTLLSLLETHSDPQILLPLYQLFSRLVALPSHRLALVRWSPNINEPGPSSASVPSLLAPIPFIIDHLMNSISALTPSSGNYYTTRKPNTKLIEASLDLLAALIKGQPSLSIAIRAWTFYEDEESMNDDESPKSEFVGILTGLVGSGPTNVRIAAASCLTNIIKADKGIRTSDRIRSTVINYQLLEEIVKLLQSEGPEERIKLCFILAALVSDDAALQKAAADKECPARLISILISVNQDEEKGEIGNDLASRIREAALLALASLAMQHDATRTLIADHSPPVLPHLFNALSSPSYGVRAAACQLARALSRTVSILRTNLIDSGIGEEIVKLLKREIASTSSSGFDEEDIGDRIWTVEVAATATLCNLVADFSPLKTVLLRENGIELLCDLTKSTYEPLALNAMWAIKNLTYHSMETTRIMITSTMGWDRLKFLMSNANTLSLRVQAFEIVQNLLAESSIAEISKTVESFGEDELLDLIIQASKEDQEVDLRIPAIFVLSNLSLGNEKIRNSIVNKIEILEILSNSLNSTFDSIKIPSLRTLRHLIESNPKNHKLRPRQQMIDIFQPYQLKYRLKELVENSTNLDVTAQSIGLLDILEREKSSGTSTSSGGR
ncbi:uncharacterized protein I206_101595 [Kwoniella pini CBS 10737]|uniref:Armadillo repeat-containing protein 8 n=1 Tax=Kwoniella pini CBS 10737 TaxID=1296096 RepID=A0A1B9HW82_9TREE|nr:uncharacterized protein I206_06435 [Kwoniella pini CBS 10737]OCF47534.1 hypothetical protein I206_06435 [Kwoniella pini CBS 10737]